MGGALKRRGVSKDDLVAILEMSKLCQTLYLHLTGLGSEDDAIKQTAISAAQSALRADVEFDLAPFLQLVGDADLGVREEVRRRRR